TIFDIQYTDIPGNDSTYPSPYVGQTVTVSGIVTAAGTAVAPNEFYISSPEGGPWNGIFVFNADGEPEAGDEVVVSGNVDEYNGFTEIHSPSISILSHNNALPAPAITSSGQLTIPWSAEAWEGGLVQVQNLAATQLVNQYGEWYVDDGSGQCQIEDEYVYFEPFVGQNFSSITGVVEYGFGQYAINPRFVEDIVAIELIAGFSSSTVTGTAPLIVAFTDQSQGNISTWWWDFGDGGTSEVQNPTHIYQNPGIYSVSLIVSDGIVSDEIIMKNLIQVNEPGQGNWLAEYFYDEDPGYGNATAIYGNGDAEVLISFNAPIGHLADGLHTFYSRSKNENGTWSQTMARTFLKQSLPGDTNPNITYLEYFFDSDPGFGEASPIAFGAGNPMEVAINLPLENLSFGLHTLYVRSQDENGKWSIVMQRSFIMGNYPADPLKQLVKAEYFIDEDPGQGMAEPVMFDPNNGIHEQQFDANLDGLEWGEHTLYVRTMDESGGWSITVAESFDVEEPPIIAEFSADITQGSVPLTVQFTDETYIGEPTEWLWDFGDGNSSNIQNPQHTYGNPGTYTVSLTATNMEGTNTEVKENYITVYPPLYSLEYFFDEDPGYGNASGVYAYSSNLGGFNFLIPMDELTDGYHLLFVRVKDTSSVWTQTMTRSFLKTRLVKDPDPNISKMEYFIDEDPGLGGAISLPLTQNPLPVVEALIPLDDYTDGLHNIFVRSQDENGRWSETFVRPFLKSYLPEDVAYVVGLEYFVDDDPGVGNGTAVSVPNPGAAIERSFVVNLGVQTPGEHRLFVRAIDSRGHWSLVYNQLIEVTATGAVHVVQLPEGWSGISSYIIPDDAAVANIFAPIQEELVIVQNFDGMYWPTAGVNTLGNWDDHAGYQIKMETAQQVTFTGEMQDNLKANLTAGWNYLPVLNACDNDVEDLFAPLIGHLQIVKDVAAWGVYWPQFGVNTLGALIPGKAYFVLVDDDVEVEFPVCETPANFRQLAERKEPASGKQTEGRKEPASEDQIDKNNQSDNSDVWSSAVALRGGSPVPSRGRAGDGVIKTPLTHTVAIPAQAISGIAEGSIITIYNQHGSCCGAAIFQNQNLALTAFGDDPTTSQIDGLTEGEPMNFRILNPETGKAFALEVVYDDQMPQGGYFVNHGLSSVKELKITGVEDAVESPMNISVYPNPSSGVFQVSTQSVRQLADQSGFGWEVSNAHGSIVATGDNHADAFTIDLSNHPKGIYYLKIKQRGWQTVKKQVLQ
ncbi:MAG: PKD domain-containing protein, partial [Bacteroidales bacterium]|nr:PKD domain-containing protein [Bacteroidales bacterium]